MKEVAVQNSLEYKKDVKLLTVGTVNDFKKHIHSAPNMTWYAIVFCTTEWDLGANISIPCTYSSPEYAPNKMVFYSLFYNNSLEPSMFINGFHKPMPRDPKLLQLK